MAMYEVFGHRLKCSYKSTFWSKATVVITVCTFLTAVLPLIITYRSSGFWLKTDTFSEQPRVTFAHDYLMLMETGAADQPVFCSSHHFIEGDLGRHCKLSSHEVDANRDGRPDEIHFSIKVPFHKNESIISVNLLLPLMFEISNVCTLKMQSMAVVQYSSGTPGLVYESVADLSFVQKRPVEPSSTPCLNFKPLYQEGISIHEIFFNYAQRNYSTTLINKYDAWIPTSLEDETDFEVNFKLLIPENYFIYRPGFWQVMKWAWIQYFSVLIIFIYIFHILQEFIFTHQLVPTYTYLPWQKVY